MSGDYSQLAEFAAEWQLGGFAAVGLLLAVGIGAMVLMRFRLG